MAELLLRAGADPNIPSRTGNTCLHAACNSGHADLVALLLKYGALPNISDLKGVTVLEAAVVTGRSLSVVQCLTNAGIDVDVWCHDRKSPITGAIKEKDFDIFKLLVRHSKNLDKLDGNGVGILHHQLVLERPEWLACLLERPGVDLDLMPLKERSPGIPPLAFAAGQGYCTSAEMLLAAGATPGYVPGQSELLPLYYAIQAEDPGSSGGARMTQLLLDYGAPINTVEKHEGWGQRTALTRAVAAKNEGLVRMLLDYGADPTVEEGCGNRGPLCLAVKRNSLPIARMLLEHWLPPDPNYIPNGSGHVLVQAVKPGEGAAMTKLLLEHGANTKTYHLPGQEESPLHYAAGDGMADVCQALIDHDPELIHLQFEDSVLVDTPLHRAARAAKPQATLACLLAAGARPDREAFFFRDLPLHAACEKGVLEAVKILYEAAPELIDRQDFYGHTPLMDACREGTVPVVEFLLKQGADVTLKDDCGQSCVSRVVDHDPGIALRLVRLLLEHGVGLADAVASDGFTILAEACVAENVPVVKYLLEKGADPIHCQRGPHGTSWRSALHIVMQRRKMGVLDVLLEREDVRNHLDSVDWNSRTVLHCHLQHPTTRMMTSKIFWICDNIEGKDVFSDLMKVRNWVGRTPVDYTRRCVHQYPAPETVLSIDRRMHRDLLTVTPVFRILRDHQSLLLSIVDPLLFRGGYDDYAITLFHRLALRTDIVEKGDVYEKSTYYNWTCDCCEKSMSDAAQEAMRVCRICQVSLCDSPKCWDVWETNAHVWFTVPFIKDTDLNSKEVQDTLEYLLQAFDPSKDEERVKPRTEPEGTWIEVPESDATTMSLAILHAFGFLEFRRRAWSPYLPLSPSLSRRLAPWDWMIGPARNYFQESVWDAELAPWKLKSELDYFLASGWRTAYQNETQVKTQAVLESMARLFEEKTPPPRPTIHQYGPPPGMLPQRGGLFPPGGMPPPPPPPGAMRPAPIVVQWEPSSPVNTLTPLSPRSMRSFSTASSVISE
ncbi:hypothetical protein ACHAQA_007858 [Verticillium albo-atrum]